jgi:hypothetical protein
VCYRAQIEIFEPKMPVGHPPVSCVLIL